MSRPSRRTSPETRAPGTTSCMRLSARRNVDFPDPEGPISAVTGFGSTVMSMSDSAWNEPNQTLSPSTSMRFAIWDPWSDKLVSAGEEAGEHREQQHDGDQRKGTRPGSRHCDRKSRARLVEDEQRQARLGPAERVGPDGVEAEGSEQQGRRLAGP